MADQDPKVQNDARDKRDIPLKYKQLVANLTAGNANNANQEAILDSAIIDIEALNYETNPGGDPLNASAEWLALKDAVAALNSNIS